MPSYIVKTFGCQMNVHDSERIDETLRASGYRRAEVQEEADLIVINTCSVREKAEQKLRSLVGTLADLKKNRPEMVIAVAGCVAQQEGKKLLSRMKQVDVIIGPDNIVELPRLVDAVAGGAPPVVRTVFDIDEPIFLRAVPDKERGVTPTAFVTVMKGCDERCSFCIVPHTRGPERYRASHEIVDEIGRLVEAGAREITLLGQTVNSYRDPAQDLGPAPGATPGDADESEFASLLRRIARDVPALSRLRYTSPHPRHLTPSLVFAHRDLDVLARHVHMPVQSGSDRVLRRMIRRYTAAEYIERTSLLVASRPGLTLSTDVIVGFPGETDDDFEATLNLVRAVKFRGVFGFKYSQRPYTPAQKLKDDVPEKAKSARLTALFALTEELQREHLDTLVGTTQEVLVEGPSKVGSNRVTGRTERSEIVHVVADDAEALIGQLVEVHIGRSFKHSLEGELTPRALALLGPKGPAKVEPVKRRALPIIASEV
ncbi:MAG TPA: tRNA (N6-isopentenyl adenosine(37)-C2)-methylthiotransferase MiaB [Polyangiaceae bacterium]|nr:tRNA (N6-isopentenyl adenosine(37)-C2)-methylthiotransferase MiaB [Polyangiaceae bacterium]